MNDSNGHWDKAADVAVAVSGTCPMAAMRAADTGLLALVGEKPATPGSTTSFSGGMGAGYPGGGATLSSDMTCSCIAANHVRGH